jgi:ribosomal protein L17
MRIDPSKMPDAIGPSTQLTPGQIPQPPTGAQNPNRVGWMQKQAEDMKPLDRNAVDPKTGKPQYRMGLGQRLLGTASNFLTGSGGGKTPPIYVGPGATNWRFDRDEATREANVARDTTALGEQEKLVTTNQKTYEDALRQSYEGQIGSARQGTAAAQQENAATRASLSQTQAELNQAKADKLNNAPPPEPKTEPEIALALQMATMKGDKVGVQKYRGALNELARQQKSAGKDTSAADIC